MIKKLLIILIMISALITPVIPRIPVHAITLPIIFSDNFNDGDAVDWTDLGSGASWAVEYDSDFDSMVLSQDSLAFSSGYDTYWRSYAGENLQNYSISAKVKIVEGGFYPMAGIFFMVQGSDLTSRYYLFRIDARQGEGPSLLREPPNFGFIYHGLNDPVIIGQTYNLKVVVENIIKNGVSGVSIKCYIDGVKKIDVFDNTFILWQPGLVGVGSFNAHVHFDDVIVTQIRAGSIVINNGDVYTNNPLVNLNLEAADAAGVTGYRISEDSDASLGTPISISSTNNLATNLSYLLSSGDGLKTISVQYRDENLNWSMNHIGTITLDTITPAVSINSPVEGVYPIGQVPDLQYNVIESNPYSVTISGFETNTGVHTVIVTATDLAGNTGSDTRSYVVYDPNTGFVTGGGWFSSPQGAYTPNPELIGKASFGFVSKYTKGAINPDGQTEFQFKVGDLNFHSSNYEWLVVAGANAKFKGEGQINNNGNYGFMITATDGDLIGGGVADSFRIKIWDKDNADLVIYDNKLGLSDSSYDAIDIAAGNIVIHTKK